jgi:hypothetical protein
MVAANMAAMNNLKTIGLIGSFLLGGASSTFAALEESLPITHSRKIRAVVAFS